MELRDARRGATMSIMLFGKEVNLHPTRGNNFIDANLLDRTGGPADDAVDRILTLAEHGKFTLLLPYSVQAEIAHPNTPPEIKRLASRLVYSIPVQLTAPEQATHQKIRELIGGNARAGKHDNDAFHVVESQKNGGRHFITNDERLLKKAPQIWQALLIRVLTASEFIRDYYPATNSNKGNP
jgi:predicted nucleic acid-binding protein